jgi:hypothetical protein
LKQLGLNAKDVIDAFNDGGPQARKAMDQVFDALREAEERGANTKDIISTLFGGPGEDLGAALFALDIQTAVEAIDGLEGSAGAADRALATMSDNTATRMEEAKRNITIAMDGIKGALASAFGDELGGVSNWVKENREAILQFAVDAVNGVLSIAEAFAEVGAQGLDTAAELATAFAQLIDALPSWLVDGEESADALRVMADGARDAADSIRDNVPAALDEVRQEVNDWAAPELLKARIHDATVVMTNDLKTFIESVGTQDLEIKINGDTVNAEEALAVLVENIDGTDGTVLIDGDKVPAEEALETLLALINRGQGDVQVGADTTPAKADVGVLKGQVSRTEASIFVTADTRAAERRLKELERDRYATLNIRVAGVNSYGGLTRHDGGPIPKGLHAGGRVPGSDPGFDNVLWPLNTGGRTLMQPLAGGEFVVNSKDAAYWGPLLDWMNGGGRPVQTFNETSNAPVYIDKVVGLTIAEVEREAATRRRRDALSPARRGS